jgi:hypothetical protein
MIGKLMGRNLSIYFYHGPEEVKLPKDIHQVDFIIDESIEEISKILDDLERFLDDDMSLEGLLENFKNTNYSGVQY